MFRQSLLRFTLCLLLLALGTSEKSLASPSLTFLVFILHLLTISLNFLFSSLQNLILQKLYSRCHKKLCCSTYIYLASKNILWVKGSFLSHKIIETNKI